MQEKGLVHLYHGNGKGKTTAAIGLAVRAAGAGRKIAFMQFMKGNDTSELEVLRRIEGITIFRSDKNFGFYGQMREEEKRELKQIHERLFEQIIEGVQLRKYDMVILDEITYAYQWNLLEPKKLEEWLQKRPGHVEIVMTGRNPAPFLLEQSDYISNIVCERHPFEKGIAARKGIEF